MPRMSAEGRKKIARAAKKRWKAWRAAQADAAAMETLTVQNVGLHDAQPSNGHGASVEHRIIVHLSGAEHPLSVADARLLRDALSQALPTP
jgi:hypothetical protein